MRDDAAMTSSSPGPVVAPTRDDPLVRSGCEVLGGPAGRRIRPGGVWWTPIRVLLALTVVVLAVGVLERGSCRANAWPRADGSQFAHVCYSDVPHLYRERGFAAGDRPYLDTGDHPALEYPVLTGAFMWVAAELTRPLAGDDVNARAVRFYDVNALLLGFAGLVTVVATARLAGLRPWDAAMVALAPVLALDGTINWDLFAVALATVGMLAWARSRPAVAGIWLGLAIAAKLYPIVLFLPLAVVCLRAGRMRAAVTAAATAVLSWSAVNLPIVLAAPESWKAFYTFNRDRGPDFGSIWYVLDQTGHPVGSLDTVVSGLLVAAFAAIVVLGLLAPARPRVAQLAFLAVAAFIVLNKVWSPQYALWLLPLAALARPRWRDFLIWQVGEVLYFLAVWYYLLGGYDDAHALPATGYHIAVLIRLGTLLWLMAVVVRDVLRPGSDPVRAAGMDDPAGGVVDGVPDRLAAQSRRRRRQAGATA
jgi:uncharacterized membrane protein